MSERYPELDWSRNRPVEMFAGPDRSRQWLMRSLRRAPGFTAAAVLILTLGIGAVVTMFAVYRAVVIDPVSLPDADRVVSIAREKRDPQVPTALSWQRVQSIRRAASAFVAAGAYNEEPLSLTGPGQRPRELRGLRVSAGFFEALRVRAATGRLLLAADDIPHGPAVCVVSYEAWASVFGGADLVGRVIVLNGRPTEVVGILEPRLSAPWGNREVILPRVFDDSQVAPEAVSAGASYLSVVARLAPGRSVAQANDDLRPISRQFSVDFAGRSDTINGLEVVPLASIVTANRGPTLALLLGAVVVVLLVACANAAALVLSRLASRQREIAVRQALGASRVAIVRHLVSEVVAIALAAGAGGLAVAAIAVPAIGAVLGGALPPGVALDLDRAAFGAAACAVAAVIVLAGVIPSIQAIRGPTGGVASFARGLSEAAGTRRFRQVLVTVEVALSAFLLVGAVVFTASLRTALRTPVGFDPAGVAAASVTLPADSYGTPESQRAFFVNVLERLERTPRVKSAAIVFGLPFADGNWVSPYVIAGRAVPPPAARRRAGLRIVTEGYLAVTRATLVAGRFFSAADRAGAQAVCVVNESFARREFGNASPLGAAVLRGRDADQRFEIVGVIGDVRTNGPNADAPDELFLPFRQVARSNASLVVRMEGDPESSAPLLQTAVADVDRDLPISGFTTMEQALASTVGPERILARLSGLFAAAALVLASVGLYAVLAHSVTTRTTEIGIRMAIGAGRRSILGLIVMGAMRLVTIGVVSGLVAAAAASRLVASQVHGIGARDPFVYVAVIVAFALVGAAASLVPAFRAMRVDPMVSLTVS